MSFFKKLFGKGTPQEPENQPNTTQKTAKTSESQNPQHEQFKEELYHSLQRYYYTPGFTVELNLTDSNGRQYKEHEAFNATFSEWQGIRSFWDRMGIFYDLWDQTERKNLAKWQVMQRYINDRYALKALDFFKENVTQEDYMDIRLPVAVSKMNRSLDNFETAKYYAQAAYELRPDLDIVKVELATVLHLSDSPEDREKGHALMNEVLEKKIKDYNGTEVSLLEFFMFGEGYIDSSVFAAMFLHVGEANLDNWDIMADEYYYCPHFRYEHAIVLHKNNDTMRMLAKLDSLCNEFPWFKKAVNTYIDAVQSVRKTMGNPDFMKNELARVEQYKAMWKQH